MNSRSIPYPIKKYTNPNIADKDISTSGYCQEIFTLQFAHLARNKKKEKTGIRCAAFKGYAQVAQELLPDTLLPVCKRKM